MPLIVNADDLGYSHHRDAAIFELFRLGKITSASVIVNGPSTQSACERARLVGLPIGLHINLTEGEPLTKNDALKLDDGRMPFKMSFRSIVKRADATFIEAVDNEVVAQIEKFKDLTGTYPTHVDGHQHVHILPNMPSVMSPIFKTYGVCSIRIPEEDVDEYNWLTLEQKEHYNTRYVDAVAARLVYMKNGFKMNDCFVGLGLTGSLMTAERIQHCLKTTSGLTEMIVHPGFVPPQPCQQKHFCDTFDTDPQRLYEFYCLRDFDFGHKLVSWSVF